MSVDQAEQLRQAVAGVRASKPKAQTPGESLLEPRTSNLEPGTSRARRIAVTSGKGGVGKTNLAANLGIALAQSGRSVVVLDADFGLANVEVVLGLTPHASLADVLSGERKLEEAVCQGPAGMGVLAGGAGLPELARLEAGQRDAAIALLQQLGSMADVILVDTPAGIGDNVLSWLTVADQALVVTTPEPAAIADAYLLMKVLAAAERPPEIGLVVNQATSGEEAVTAEVALVGVVQRLLRLTLCSYGLIPYDETLPRAVRQQSPVLLAWPRSPASLSIRRIAHMLFQAKDPAPAAAARSWRL